MQGEPSDEHLSRHHSIEQRVLLLIDDHCSLSFLFLKTVKMRSMDKE